MIKFVCQGQRSGQGQGHSSKKRVCVACSRMVCLRLKGNLVSLVIMIYSYYYAGYFISKYYHCIFISSFLRNFTSLRFNSDTIRCANNFACLKDEKRRILHEKYFFVFFLQIVNTCS